MISRLVRLARSSVRVSQVRIDWAIMEATNNGIYQAPCFPCMFSSAGTYLEPLAVSHTSKTLEQYNVAEPCPVHILLDSYEELLSNKISPTRRTASLFGVTHVVLSPLVMCAVTGGVPVDDIGGRPRKPRTFQEGLPPSTPRPLATRYRS